MVTNSNGHRGAYAGAPRIKLVGWGQLQPWEIEAACKDAPIELFFGTEKELSGRPKGSSRRTKAQTAEALVICNSCPVLRECREWGITSGIPYGLIGGLTELQRERERKRRGRTEKHQQTGNWVSLGVTPRANGQVPHGTLRALPGRIPL